MDIKLEIQNIKKIFNGRKVFSDINFKLENKSALAITGRNGSGKSTLVKILAGVLSPTNGQVDFYLNGKSIDVQNRFQYFGFVAPYLQMYDEFTAMENLELFARIRSIEVDKDYIDLLLKRVNLYERKDSYVREYSSGMKQRLKYAFALLHKPPLLILDEPRSNLDAEGIAVVYQIIQEQKQSGCVIVATNDSEDIQFCNQEIDLNQFRNKAK
ncbi:MAG: ABC transporter ATP-binding protein [Bacteroidota bacterium]|nr:ABC transporter ATP-binding protein [Bacteroidota bacterium]